MNGNKMEKQRREEVAMVPKAGWGEKADNWDGGEEAGDEETTCGVGECRPQPLKLFSGLKTFTFIFGLNVLFIASMRTYLASQYIWIQRLYDITPGQYELLINCVNISFLVVVLFISYFARRMHIPRTLSVATVIVGIAAVLCVIPHAVHKSDLTPAPNVTEESKFTIEKLLMMAPTCTENKQMKDAMTKMLMGGPGDCDDGTGTSASAAATGGAGGGSAGAGTNSGAKPASNTNTVVDRQGSGPAYSSSGGNGSSSGGAAGDNTGSQPADATGAGTANAAKPGTGEAEPGVGTGGDTAAENPPQPMGPMKMQEVPDFKLIRSHKMYPTLKNIAASVYKMDLDYYADMDRPELVAALAKLGPGIQEKLPELKAMLGENADSYFFKVAVPATAPTTAPGRRKRQAAQNTGPAVGDEPSAKEQMLQQLKQDGMWTGQLAMMVRTGFAEIFGSPCTQEKIRKMVNSMCPFNTGPFLEDTEEAARFTLVFVAIGMVLLGLAEAVFPAFLTTYVDNRTTEVSTGIYLGAIFSMAPLGGFLAIIFAFVSATTYITMEDVGAMTNINPRWLSAWWIGFMAVAVACFVLAIPTFFFPNPRDRRSRGANRKVVKGFFQSFMRLLSNPVFLLITLGNAVSSMAVEGMLESLSDYVKAQFSFVTTMEGPILTVIILIVMAVGVFIGGIIATCGKLSPFNCLKMVVGCALVAVVLQAATLGLGCGQTEVNKGDMIVNDTMTQQPIQCSQTCVCIDFVYMPVCGSDGVSYYSPCHAGCGHPLNGEWHHCKCIGDEVMTAKPGLCQQDCQGGMFYGYGVVMALTCFVLSMMVVPAFLATYRSVERIDMPMAIGLNAFLETLIGIIPSRMIFKAMFDGICLLETDPCGPGGSCRIYDTEALRMRFNGVGTGLKALAALLYVIAMVLGFRNGSVFGRAVYKTERRK